MEKGVDKQKKVCYNWLTAKTKETKLVVNQIGKTGRKLKREVNRRRKLKAGLKLKQKGGENMAGLIALIAIIFSIINIINMFRD